MKVFLTGGTGFIGGYVANTLKDRGHDVVALARPTSNTAALEAAGVSIARGDVTDAASIASGMDGCDTVIHCAAVVGAYGSWRDFEQVGVQGTANVIDAAEQAGAKRFIHLGSIAVYGTNPRGRTYTDSTPFEYKPEGWNHYVREKVLSERLLWEAHGYERIRATSIRPSIVVGPGDRNFLPRAISAIRFRFTALAGSGNNYAPLVVIDEVAEATVRAAESEATIGNAYNLSGAKRITQAEVFNIVADAIGAPRVQRTMSFNVAMTSAAMLEFGWKLARRRGEPPVTRFGISLIGQQYDIACANAVRDLGWKGEADYAPAIEASIRHTQQLEA